VIAKYPAACMYCKKPIAPGVDTYDLEIKKSYHEDCRANQPPGPEDFALAEELGFVRHDEASIRAAAPSWRVRDRWLLRHLLDADRGNSAGRPPAAPQGRPNATLFDKRTRPATDQELDEMLDPWLKEPKTEE
jgi:hypothetical protein